MKQLILLSLLVLVFIISACKTKKQNKTSNEAATTVVKEDLVPANHLISMSKGACYGTCPVYTMNVHENGVVKFEGKQFCDKTGPHIAQLSSEQLAALKQEVGNINFETFLDKIESMIADLPGTELTFYRADASSKSIWWNMNGPEQLLNLSAILETYRGALDWKVNNDAPLPEGAIPNQFLIYLKEGVKGSDFAKQFSDYNFIPKRELLPEDNYWLFEFDLDKITSYEMYNLIHKTKKIQNVRFNTKVAER